MSELYSALWFQQKTASGKVAASGLRCVAGELIRFMEGNDIRAAWFCLRTHLKHEHIAAAQLRQDPEIEVFLPRIRYLRPTRSGPAWVTEALFQNYLFARFELATALRRIEHARGVRGVVHFGARWPTIPDQIIEQLRQAMNGYELRVLEDGLQSGDVVEITDGALRGLEAVVTRVMPAKHRVAVLLDFLGRQTAVEMESCQVTRAEEDAYRRACFGVECVSRQESVPGSSAFVAI